MVFVEINIKIRRALLFVFPLFVFKTISAVVGYGAMAIMSQLRHEFKLATTNLRPFYKDVDPHILISNCYILSGIVFEFE